MIAPLLLAAGASCMAPERLLEWPSGGAPAWSLCVRTPRDSSGPSGSGLEVRDAFFNGHPVLRSAGAPIVSVDYQAGCGCSRGWSSEEAPFEVTGFAGPMTGAPGSWAEAAVPPRTSCETGEDASKGAFSGVAVERLADRVVLTTHMSAGPHRYTMSWTFRLDGSIEPRFAWSGAGGSCASHDHFHQVYWRFDLDVGGAALSGDREEMRFSGAPGRDPAGVVDPATGRGYQLLAGREALALPDPSTEGDVWILLPKPEERTDAGSGCRADFGGMLDAEPLAAGQRVLWYRGGAFHAGTRFEECERVGPMLSPVGDWSRAR